jgi:hypothetical protein
MHLRAKLRYVSHACFTVWLYTDRSPKLSVVNVSALHFPAIADFEMLQP